MVRVLVAVAAALLAMCGAAAASAADQPQYAPPPDWAHIVSIPSVAPPADSSPAQVLLVNLQTRLGPDGEDFFSETATKILAPEGLSSVGTIAMTWDPDTETLIIHSLKIIRGAQVIDALADGHKFLVLRRENKLELAVLDGRLTATIEPEGLQVGDIVDVAATIQRRDPALKGHATGFDALDYPGVGAHVVMRATWGAATPVRWRVTEGMPQPQLTHTATGSDLVIDATNIAAPKPPKGAPARFMELGALELTDFPSWAALSQLMSPLYDKAATLAAASPLQAEIARIAALGPDPKVRAMAALRLVEDQVRYVFLGMNDGGIVPADADQTWSRRFGDCKGKTALLVALLHGLGIQAEPSLVSTSFGDGLDARLPAATWFDHVMVRAVIGGKTYWLDGTRVGDRSLDDLEIPGWGWTLPVRDTGAELVKLTPQPLTTPGLTTTLTIDASKGVDAPAPTHLEQVFRGDYAVSVRTQLASAPRADFERALRELWSKTYPWLEVAQLTITEESADGAVRFAGDGAGKLDWRDESDGSRLYRVPGSAMAAAVSFRREPGPNIDAPFTVAFPYFAVTQRRITLPAGGDYTLIGIDIDQTVGGQALLRRSRIENGVLTIDSQVRTTGPEFPAAQAEAASLTLRDLAQKDVAVAFHARAAGATPAPQSGAPSTGPPPGAGGGAHFAGPAAPVTLEQDQALAARGDAGAETRLGMRYERGDGVPFDLAAARSWLTKSAEAGNLQGETALAGLLMSRHDPAVEAEAAGWLRKAADGGFAPAQALLANCYEVGRGVAKDPAAAIALLNKAAAQGDPVGEALLGDAYIRGLGVPQNYNEAFVYLTQSAAQGNPGAEFALALLYHDGLGTPKDPARSVQLLHQAADQGSRDASYMLGVVYRRGLEGSAPDYAQALIWYGKAAAQGDPRAEVDLGVMAEEGQGEPVDHAQSMSWLQKAAAQNSPDAITDIGEFYLHGGGGVARDYTQAVTWLQRAVDLGYAHAQSALGDLYVTGHGVAEDDARALDLAHKSADQGDADGEYLLGFLYWRGKGVVQDDSTAFYWIHKSAVAGNVQAESVVGAFYRDGRGVVRDYAQALMWLTKAAAVGFAFAEFSLGQVYELGLGVARDPQAAAHWYALAVQHGETQAPAALARLSGAHPAGLPPPIPPPPLNIAPAH